MMEMGYVAFSLKIAPFAFIGGFLLVALVIAVPVAILVRIGRAIGGRSKGTTGQEGMELVREIHAGLAAMERRIESLETILLDRRKVKP